MQKNNLPNDAAAFRKMVFPLEDGGRVLLRPVLPSDSERIVRGLNLMSLESRYLRFFAPVEKLSEKQLEEFTQVDQVNHVAWAALNADDLDYPGFGVGRFVRTAANASEAEIAITVVDAHQKRGIGTLLLAVLYIRAIQLGLTSLVGNLLPENRYLGTWLALLGARTYYDGGIYKASIPIHPDYSIRLAHEKATSFIALLDLISRQIGDAVPPRAG